MQRPLKLSRGAVPLCLTAAVMVIFFFVFWICPMSAPGSHAMLTSEFRRQYGMVSSYDQRTAYLASVIAIVILSAAAFIVRQRKLVQSNGRTWIPTINIWISALITIADLVIYSTLIQAWIVTCAAVLAACFFTFVVFAPYLQRRIVEFVALLVIGAYLSIVIFPGFFVWPVAFPVADAISVAQLELHLNSLVQPGSIIAAGQNFFREIPFGYGLLMPSILSVIAHRHGPLTVGDHVLFVQVCQVVFTVTAALAYFSYRPRNYLGILAALLLAAPYWASTGLGIWHPNQTGFRSLTLPLGILAMALAGHWRPNDAAWALGAVGMVALLINLETTVAVGGGMFVYLVLRTRSFPLIAILRVMIGAALVFMLYLVTYRIGLGRLPFGVDFYTILNTFREHVSGDVGMRLFDPGYWGEGYYLVPLALVMFTHATYVVISSFHRLGVDPLSPRRALRAGIATILILWFAYYINMPNWWQIWTHLFLYGFLLIDLFDLRHFAVGTALRQSTTFWGRRRRLRSPVLYVIPILLLSVTLFHTNSNLAYYTRDFLSPPWTRTNHSAVVLSELKLRGDVANALKEKSNYLLELNRKNPGKILYLTYNIEFVPMLTRLFEPAPARSLWGYIASDAALDPAIAKMFKKHPAAILIDAPTGPLAVSGPRKEFQDRVRLSVSREYHVAETVAGWQVWRPNLP